MQKNSTSFLLNVDSDFYPEPDKSVFDNLFEQYERVIFSSIITAFGLDLFIKDQVGGDVDTICNVRKGIYKNDKNQEDYNNRGSYSHKDVEGTDTNYQKIKSQARKAYHEDNSNTVQDAYENKPLGFLGNSKGHPTDKSAELDHVISANEAHNDRARLLAGLSTKELVDNEINLKWTNEHLNKSMGKGSIPDYIANHPELSDDTKERMMARYNQAREAYEKKLARAYYLDPNNPNCQRFYLDTGKAAINRGWQMGVRQVLGFVLTEVWFSIKYEFKASGQKVEEKISAIITGVKKGFQSAKEKYKDIISKFGEGTISGIISSLSTTLCNIFFTTSKNIGKIIRQSWSSIVEASKVIIFNPEDLWFCDRMTSAAKILATGACVIMGTGVQEYTKAKLTGFNPTLADIISIFAGSLCTGLLTVTFLFYIDNNPFDSYLSKEFDGAIQNYRIQAKLFNDYCAKLQCIDTEKFARDTEAAHLLSEKLSKIHDDNELNFALKNAAESMEIESPWGNGSLDAFMRNPDPNKKIIFKA